MYYWKYKFDEKNVEVKLKKSPDDEWYYNLCQIHLEHKNCLIKKNAVISDKV